MSFATGCSKKTKGSPWWYAIMFLSSNNPFKKVHFWELSGICLSNTDEWFIRTFSFYKSNWNLFWARSFDAFFVSSKIIQAFVPWPFSALSFCFNFRDRIKKLQSFLISFDIAATVRPCQEQHLIESSHLTLLLPVTHCVGHNTQRLSNRKISKTSRINIVFITSFSKEYLTRSPMISRLNYFVLVVF